MSDTLLPSYRKGPKGPPSDLLTLFLSNYCHTFLALVGIFAAKSRMSLLWQNVAPENKRLTGTLGPYLEVPTIINTISLMSAKMFFNNVINNYKSFIVLIKSCWPNL
jgi:hypothetical protein